MKKLILLLMLSSCSMQSPVDLPDIKLSHEFNIYGVFGNPIGTWYSVPLPEGAEVPEVLVEHETLQLRIYTQYNVIKVKSVSGNKLDGMRYCLRYKAEL